MRWRVWQAVNPWHDFGGGLATENEAAHEEVGLLYSLNACCFLVVFRVVVLQHVVVCACFGAGEVPAWR